MSRSEMRRMTFWETDMGLQRNSFNSVSLSVTGISFK